MDSLSIFSVLSSTITIENLTIRFMHSLDIKHSLNLENKVKKIIEDFKNAEQQDTDSLISLLNKIPQFSRMKKDYLKTQFENTLKEFSDSK